MADAADLVITNAEVHTLATPDETAAAVAVRDGRIARVGSAYEVSFLEGVETETIDLGGRVLLPGFVDAHTHMDSVGRYGLYADLRGASGPEECIERLRGADDGSGWVLGFGFDESTWEEPRYLNRDDLDRVSEERPVAAIREDGHLAAVNSVALDRHRDGMPDGEVRTEGGEPTGVIVEDAVGVVRDATAPDHSETKELLLAAQERAHELGVTGVHDMVREGSHAPGAYRELARSDDLALRVRLNYYDDLLGAMEAVGLRTNDGADVRTGAVKSFADGSIGGRTAKVTEPYEDGEGRGQWLSDPEELREVVRRAGESGYQVATHAIGDEAVEAVLDSFEGAEDPGGSRHRVEHAEMCSEGTVERFADLGVVASVQPNFLKWARGGGLYDQRLGEARRKRSNPYREFLDAGVPLAFGSDGMPFGPLVGVHQTVNAPVESQRLSVTEALRAYTLGAAYAGFDEDRLGTVEAGKLADLVALERSPWEHPGEIEDIDAALTVVGGEVVHDGR